MNYKFTLILLILIALLTVLGAPVVQGANTQTNVSGSNTSIEGGYTGGATTYESGSSSSTTTNSTSNVTSNITQDQTTLSVTCSVPASTVPPTNTDFIFFAKDNTVNMASLAGYYGVARFINNAVEKAEMFAASCEISESSK